MGDMNPIFDAYAMDEAKQKARAEGYAAGYEAGQREMRETAAKHLERCRRKEAFLVDIAIGIRALPINPPPAET